MIRMVQMGKINWMKVHCSKFDKERDHHHCPGGSLSGGIPVQGGSLSRGGLCPVEISVRETPPDREPPYTVKSGQYASYWNAFLF